MLIAIVPSQGLHISHPEVIRERADETDGLFEAVLDLESQAIETIFNASDKAGAQRLLKQAVELWAKDAPKLAEWAEPNLADGFTVFDFPQSHRICLRTTNGLERVNRKLKRRTRVASIFPNAASCLRLVSALLADCVEEWMTGRIYMTFQP